MEWPYSWKYGIWSSHIVAEQALSSRAIPVPQFRTLQKRIFPAYFNLQLFLIAAVAATYPNFLVFSLVQKWDELIPIGVMFITSSLNGAVFGPQTLRAMIDQTHQGELKIRIHILTVLLLPNNMHAKTKSETRDGCRYGDVVKSNEMKAVTRRFSKAYAMSIHLNLIAIVATIWYGVILASKLSYRNTTSFR
jgi:hypothetical protein